MKLLKEWGPFTLFIIAIILLRVFVWKPVLVDGHSMDPTLADKQRLIIVKTAKIKRKQIVVAREYDTTTGKKKDIVKRVIGLPGDTVTFNSDVLKINDKIVKEPYLTDYQNKFKKDKLQQTYSYSTLFQEIAKTAEAFTVSASGETSFSIKVPKGEYFLMGDDRLVSQDSRQVGTFAKKDIIGRVTVRTWPLKKIGFVD